MTLANKITLARFLLALVSFATVGLVGTWPAQDVSLLIVSYVLFLIVAFSDMLDGWAARKYGEVTEIGRIADPMVDKIAVCGVLIFTQRIPVIAALVPTWMIVLIVVREFVVSGIRGACEAKGIPFPANAWGKMKAFLQNVLCGAVLIYAAHLVAVGWCTWFVSISAWTAAVATLVSGLIYIRQGARVLRAR